MARRERSTAGVLSGPKSSKELESHRLDGHPATGSTAASTYCQGHPTSQTPQGLGLAVADDTFACRQTTGGAASDNQGSSRMKGNFHVRFLEGGGLPTARSYAVKPLHQTKFNLRFPDDSSILTRPCIG